MISKMAIAIDSSLAFSNFFTTQSELYTHIVPINIILSDGNQIPIDNDNITTAQFENKKAKWGQNVTTSQPTIGQIRKVINDIESSALNYKNAFFLCVNSGGSGYYKSLLQYIKQHKNALHCKYWVFSINTLFYSSWLLLNLLNKWIKSGITGEKIYKKLDQINYREYLIALPIYLRKIKKSGRFSHKRFSKRVFSLIHLKFLVLLTFTSLNYKYKVFRFGVSINALCKSLGRFLRKKEQYRHIILYYCVRDEAFFKMKLRIIKKFSKNQKLKFYLAKMPICYYALLYKNYMFGLYERSPARLPFIEKYKVSVPIKKKSIKIV